MNLHYGNQIWVTFVLGIAVVGCSKHEPEASKGRWYTSAQVEQGRALFEAHCASCHGAKAEGTAEWQQTDADGNYPPPPLNGSGHAWHHPLFILEQTVAEGGAPLGGVMPGFAETLSVEEARSSIAYFQSLWSDEIYTRWRAIDAQ